MSCNDKLERKIGQSIIDGISLRLYNWIEKLAVTCSFKSSLNPLDAKTTERKSVGENPLTDSGSSHWYTCLGKLFS